MAMADICVFFGQFLYAITAYQPVYLNNNYRFASLRGCLVS